MLFGTPFCAFHTKPVLATVNGNAGTRPGWVQLAKLFSFAIELPEAGPYLFALVPVAVVEQRFPAPAYRPVPPLFRARPLQVKLMLMVPAEALGAAASNAAVATKRGRDNSDPIRKIILLGGALL